MSRLFLKWWLLFVTQVILVSTVHYFGGTEYLLAHDKTLLSFFIVSIWLIISLSIGFNFFRNKQATEFHWFSADSCMSIGMIGTVIGFILMLGGSLSEIDPSNVASMRIAISNMAMGMSTALLTTLSGLIASLFLKGQLILSGTEDETQIL